MAGGAQVSAVVADETDAETVVMQRPTHGRYPIADAVIMCEEILDTLYANEARTVLAYLNEKFKDAA